MKEVFSKISINIKKIWIIAFPMVVQGIVFQLQSLTDKAFLGNLDSKYISALGASQFPLNATMDSLYALGTGLIIIVSRLFGAKDKKTINKYVVSNSFFGTILTVMIFIIWFFFPKEILGLFRVDSILLEYCIPYVKICSVFILFIGIDSSMGAYFQGIGKTRPIMISGISKVIANIVISYVLIFGHLGFPALGMVGAAIGTLMSNIITFGVFFSYFYIIKRKEYLWELRSIFEVRFSLYWEVLCIGVPTALEYFMWNASNLVLMTFLNEISYKATAIYTLTFGIEVIVFVIFDGTGKASMTLIGQGIGAKENKLADWYLISCIVVNLVLISIFIAIALLFGTQVLGVFSNDADLIESASPFLVFTGIIMISKSMNVAAGNGIRANKDTRWMLNTQIIGSICTVLLSFILVRVFGVGVLGVYITLFFDESLRAIINITHYIKRYSSFSKCD